MASSSDDEEANSWERFQDLCRELNMDEDTSQEAWSSYQKISTNYTLEVSSLCLSACVRYMTSANIVNPVMVYVVAALSPIYCDQKPLTNRYFIFKHFLFQGESLHWLACALYVACRKSVVPTVDSSGTVEGNCVSLTRLLRAAKLR